MAERALKLVALAHVEDLQRAVIFLERLRLDFPNAGETIGERRPARIGGGEAVVLGPAAVQISGHGDIDLFGMGELEILPYGR